MSDDCVKKIERYKKARKSLMELEELPNHLSKILVETKKKYGYTEHECYLKWIRDYDRMILECEKELIAIKSKPLK
jgi:hypothetical protein